MGRFADLANEALQGRGTSDLQLPTGLAPQIDEAGSARVDALGAQSMDLINGKGASEVPQPPPIKKIVTTFDENGNPVHDYQGISDTAHKFLQGLMQDGAQARQAYDAAISQVSSIRQAMEANPLITQIGRLANAYAANVVAPTPAGTFARSAAEVAYGTLKDRPEDLAAQEAKLASQKIATQVPLLNALETSGKIEELKQYREQREEDRRRGQVQGLADDFDKLARTQSLTMEYVNARIAASPFIKPEEAEALRNQAWAAQTGYRIAAEKEQKIKFQQFKEQKDYDEMIRERDQAREDERQKLARIAVQAEGNSRIVVDQILKDQQARNELEKEAVVANSIVRDIAGSLGLPPETPVEKVRLEVAKRMAPGYKDPTGGKAPPMFSDDKQTQEMRKQLDMATGTLGLYKTKYDQYGKNIQSRLKLLPEHLQKAYAEPETPVTAQPVAAAKPDTARFMAMTPAAFKAEFLAGKTGLSQAEGAQILAQLTFNAQPAAGGAQDLAAAAAAKYGPSAFMKLTGIGPTLEGIGGGVAGFARGLGIGGDGGAPPAKPTPSSAPAVTPTPYPGTPLMTSAKVRPYAATINKYAAEYGVNPEQIARTIQEESGFNPKKPAGDKGSLGGFSQAKPGTAAQFGLKKEQQNDPEASIRFVARYLAYLKAKFGDEKAATLAYQQGEENVRKGKMGPIGKQRLINVHGIETLAAAP